MMLRGASVVLLLAMLSGGSRPTHAQKPLVIHTQNLLRFGHGPMTAYKCAALDTASVAVDVILIQELMQQAYPCATPPTNFTFHAFGPMGTKSYMEWYGFLIRTVARDSGPTIAVTTVTHTATGRFARPPWAILLNVTPYGGTTKQIWLANIHSVWGTGGVKPRRDEATAAAVFFTDLKTSPAGGQNAPARGFPVIIAGDWNIQARDATTQFDTGFRALAIAGADILPNFPTSLTRPGLPSSPYDHFAYSNTSLTLTSAAVYPAANWTTWRQTTSDHLGVRVNVAFLPW